MNIAKMMKQAQQMQAKAQQMQNELALRMYEAKSGGGAVTVVATGDGQVASIKIDPGVLKEGDAEMVEDLVLTAVREAIEKGRKEASAEMSKLTAGLNIPGLM